jgi:hypothetical protein
MFTKHVWYDRKHQAEVFITDEGVVSGTILAYQGGVCIVNPRPEILAALYSESKIKRILSLKSVILTENTLEFTRGLCALLNYSRGLRRKTPLEVIAREESHISVDVINNCCSRLIGGSSFDLTVVPVGNDLPYVLGGSTICFQRLEGDAPEANPRLVVSMPPRTLHFLDESHVDHLSERTVIEEAQPSVIIRTASLPQRHTGQLRHRLPVLS